MSGIGKFVEQYNGQYAGYKLEQLKNAVLYIPVHADNHIDFDTMETFIKALEKLCIRSVVEWKDKIIETTKRVVG